MRELFIECPPLLIALFIIKAKTLILRLKYIYLLFERRILIRRQSKAFLENGCRSMLVEKTLNFSEERESHANTPNVIFAHKRGHKMLSDMSRHMA
jgi:hypothetical protein